MKIHLTSVYVDNQREALDFYTNVLGFQLCHDIPLGDVQVEVQPVDRLALQRHVPREHVAAVRATVITARVVQPARPTNLPEGLMNR